MIALAENIGKLLAPLEEYADVFACRIRAVSRLYWKNQEILFYTNSINSSFYVESGNAVVWISPHSTAKDKAELCDLLAVTARTVRANHPLPLAGYTETRGLIYGGCTAYHFTQGAAENLRGCLAVWEQVFPDAFSGEAGRVRYADCSHRIRHEMSRAFCLEDKAALFAFCEDHGYAVIDQLGVLPAYRGNGLAMSLLCHAAAVLRPENGFLFESKDALSDHFYEKNDFQPMGGWYAYRTRLSAG